MPIFNQFFDHLVLQKLASTISVKLAVVISSKTSRKVFNYLGKIVNCNRSRGYVKQKMVLTICLLLLFSRAAMFLIATKSILV